MPCRTPGPRHLFCRTSPTTQPHWYAIAENGIEHSRMQWAGSSTGISDGGFMSHPIPSPILFYSCVNEASAAQTSRWRQKKGVKSMAIFPFRDCNGRDQWRRLHSLSPLTLPSCSNFKNNSEKDHLHPLPKSLVVVLLKKLPTALCLRVWNCWCGVYCGCPSHRAIRLTDDVRYGAKPTDIRVPCRLFWVRFVYNFPQLPAKPFLRHVSINIMKDTWFVLEMTTPPPRSQLPSPIISLGNRI